MSKFIPTASQAAAINARGSAVLVSAGAGSGKTKVLTERLMSRITDPQDPADLDTFLVITFTRAAAGELRGRIMDALAAAQAADPGNKRLRRQSALCQRAQIGTIHSFCAAVLRENSHLIGLTPDFKIADDDRAAAMKLAAVERVMDAHYDNSVSYPGFSELADTVGIGRDDKRLVELVLTLHEKMQCHARPELWAKEQVAQLKAEASDVSQTPWGKEILTWAREEADYWCSELERVMSSMEPYEKICKAYMPGISATQEMVRALSAALSVGWDDARKHLPVTFPKLGALRDSPAPQVSELVKTRKDACKKSMDSIFTALASDSASLLEELALTVPAMSALLELTLSFDKEFSKAKRRAGLVDYSDLEHLTAKLLTEENGTPTPLARQLSLRYTEIMVDEYQDVSLVQDTIFRAVSRRETNLFMVGDIKQAIYRFRLADPKIFTEKYFSYKDYTDAAQGEPRRIMLRENFRSRREIIDCVNSVFSACMSRALGDIDYDEAAALKYGASYEGTVAVPELLLLDISKSDDEDSPEKTVAEAELVAGKMQELNRQGVPYGDMAILLRSANTVGGTYRSVLTRFGIPVSMGQGKDYFTSIEISSLMSLLAVTDNPHQDIPLIAVLRSPFFGFSPDELSKIREFNRVGDFWQALISAAQSDNKCTSFVDKLAEFRRISPDISAAELVWKMLSDLDMLAICSAMPDGEQRRANLMELINLSERFESSGYRGLHRFVLWLRRLSEKGQEISASAPSASAVQIISVHKSKGLEFPVVFLCDTARRFNKKDSRETVLVHPELGLGPKLTDVKRRIEYPTLARNAIKLRSEQELLSEEMRLLYVALTRAKERLFITAAVKNPEQMIETASTGSGAHISPKVLRQASGPVNWLIHAAVADNGEHIKKFTLHSTEQYITGDDAAEAADEISVAASDISEKMGYSYSYKATEALPSKVTATELKYFDDEDAQSIAPVKRAEFHMPEFAETHRTISGAEKGIATHTVLQYMDFSKGSSIKNIACEIERLKKNAFISAAEADAVDVQAIYRLFSSTLGQRIRKADRVTREFKFSILCEAEQFFETVKGEKLLLQGVVDCCIEEDGKLVIIDYKTDHVKTKEALASRAELYKSQLLSYSAALCRIFKKEIKECVLYFLDAGESVEISEKDLH